MTAVGQARIFSADFCCGFLCSLVLYLQHACGDRKYLAGTGSVPVNVWCLIKT
jgi:hypothetical protein